MALLSPALSSLRGKRASYPLFQCLGTERNFLGCSSWITLGLFEVSASYDRYPNGACVPVREPGPKIPVGSLVKLRMLGSMRNYPV